MVKRSALAMTCAVAAISGLSAQSAFAGTVAVDTDAQTGVKRVLFGESREAVDPLNPPPTGPSRAIPEPNAIKITLGGGVYTITDTSTAITPRGSSCSQGANANTVTCPADGVQKLVFPLGMLNDTFDNQTATPADINGGGGTDRIIQAGAGNDTIDIGGNEIDEFGSCGAGTDALQRDVRDTVPATYAEHQCETINGVDQTTPAATPGGGANPTPGGPVGSGSPPPAAPTNTAPVNASQIGTAAPVPVQDLGVAPTQKAGACLVPFIGTAAADRIDGSANGDVEYGQAGDDFMNGQSGDDCLYGMDGNDTLIGDDGLDLLVGGNGNDKGFGGKGNDKLFGNAGADTMNGNDGTDRLSGGAGNDKLYGDAGDDTVLGSAGNDRLSGAAGNDVLSGGEGADLILGGAGRDSINGGKGADRIDAGAGNDTINVRDGQKDVVSCGLGRDSVTADKKDVLRGCERVSRR
jgi:Ca2+-binding RTX toxin-like protein